MSAVATLGAKAATPEAARGELVRAALSRALERADVDEKAGPLLRAARLRLRLAFTDSGMTLDVGSREGSDSLEWSFDEEPQWRPKLELAMDTETANRWLQGRESLPIAIARGKVRCRGESRTALLYLPATRLICEPYRRVVAEEFHQLLVD